MGRQTIVYHFHNPNTAEITADYIAKLFVEANGRKMEQALRNAAAPEPRKEPPIE